MDNLLFAVLLDLGLIGIALMCLAEKLLPVVPSYALLVSFGLTVAHDTTGLLGVVFASTCGSVLGAIGWYTLGRLIGPELSEQFVARFGKYVLLRPAFYQRLMAAYDGKPLLLTALGQAVPAARIYLPLPAGVIGLSFVPFVLATTLGALIWNAPLVILGYLLRSVG